MKECVGDIMNYIGKVAAICVTTNGFVKRSGECVMGRGIAKNIADKYPTIPKLLGRKILEEGNKVQVITNINGTDIIAFPVKPSGVVYNGENVVKHAKYQFQIGESVPGFYAKADVKIIERSCKELEKLQQQQQYSRIILPLMGCGAGELSYNKDVKPIVHPILNSYDNIYLFSFKQEDFSK